MQILKTKKNIIIVQKSLFHTKYGHKLKKTNEIREGVTTQRKQRHLSSVFGTFLFQNILLSCCLPHSSMESWLNLTHLKQIYQTR